MRLLFSQREREIENETLPPSLKAALRSRTFLKQVDEMATEHLSFVNIAVLSFMNKIQTSQGSQKAMIDLSLVILLGHFFLVMGKNLRLLVSHNQCTECEHEMTRVLGMRRVPEREERIKLKEKYVETFLDVHFQTKISSQILYFTEALEFLFL